MSDNHALRARAKAKTEELRQEMDGMDGTMRELRKVVKMVMAQQYWVEFGITDQR